MKGLLVASALLASCVSGHIQMSKPYPIRSPLNSDGDGQKDYSYTNPLSTDGSDYPCKGYANDPFKSVADYTPGQTYELELQGSATHGGGSCQIALSYDKGETFKVIHSMLGGCPIPLKYNFQVPSDAPSGEALLAWSWFNKVGNREMYMNCAMVTIKGGSQARLHARDLSPALSRRAGGFDGLPSLFVANVNGPGKCKTIEGQEVNFPLPGPSVEGSLSGKGYQCEGSAPFLGSGDSSSNSPKVSSSAQAGASTATPSASSQSVSTPSSSHAVAIVSSSSRAVATPSSSHSVATPSASGSAETSSQAKAGASENAQTPTTPSTSTPSTSTTSSGNLLGDALRGVGGLVGGLGGPLRESPKPSESSTPESGYMPESQSAPESGYNPQSASQSAEDSGYKPESQSSPQSGYQPETQSNPDSGYSPQSGSHSAPESGYKPESAESDPESAHKPQSAPSAPESGYKPQAESQSKPEFGYKPESESASKPESKNNFDAEHAPHPKPAFASQPGPAHEFPETCAHGDILCGTDGQTWAMCDWGRPVYMGPVAAGTRCRHGAMERI
ncbi:hypothetical protein CNMCM6106_008999 [Aspergillus hiratsukae]|uniref:Extracellular protein n=1 Tax=Aspergillus hiratsukae TaxID=1194566 RepID=A0A8H6PWY9_9EURO|nr:hypothetical protein CNMCM6106_008999 [Aspergillus hiratsukae]